MLYSAVAFLVSTFVIIHLSHCVICPPHDRQHSVDSQDICISRYFRTVSVW